MCSLHKMGVEECIRKKTKTRQSKGNTRRNKRRLLSSINSGRQMNQAFRTLDSLGLADPIKCVVERLRIHRFDQGNEIEPARGRVYSLHRR